MRGSSIAPARRVTAFVAVVFGAIVATAAPGPALAAWVKDEVNLQLRTGAGNQYRITGRIRTGDSVEVLEVGDGWTRVRVDDGEEGWVPAGFLQEEPPARVVLERIEGDTAQLRDEVERLQAQTAALQVENERLSGQDSGQRAEIERLTRENMELRAGARWPEWITGTVIVLVGMLLGSWLSRAGRRRQQRIRL